MSQYQITIGIEVHAELATKTKMFCGCLNAPFESEPNTNICPICLGLPGTLPVMNKQAIEWTIDLGFDLGAQVAKFTKWDRKNYFYPDLPKGYQISQYDLPLLSGGAVEFKNQEGKVVRIALTRVHLEEDTGKLIHGAIKRSSATSQESLGNISKESRYSSYIDYNRAGVPLLELVTEPVIHSAQDAKKFCETYQVILRRRGIARADMEKGEMRCEANISVQQYLPNQASSIKHQALGTKVEVKNLNSFKSIEKAIEYEVERQIKLLKAGKKVTQQTRGWDEVKQKTFVQRVKETAADYRYFPEPDLPPVTPSALWNLSRKENSALAQPHLLAKELEHDYGLPMETAEFIAGNAQAFADWSELVNEIGSSGPHEQIILRQAGKFYVNLDSVRRLPAPDILDLARLAQDYQLAQSQIRDIVDFAIKNTVTIREAATTLGLDQKQDQSQLESVVLKVLAANDQAVAKIKSGDHKVIGFLIGQVMAELKGQANPKKIKKIIERNL